MTNSIEKFVDDVAASYVPMRDVALKCNLVEDWWRDSVRPTEVAATAATLSSEPVVVLLSGHHFPADLPGLALHNKYSSQLGVLHACNGSPAKLVIQGSHVASSLPGIGRPEWQPFLLQLAERRLAELQVLSNAPTLFGSETPDDEPQLPLSSSAVQRARRALASVASWSGLAPIGHISIFSMPDGGLQLQRSGPSSSISIEIPAAADQPVMAEFAADNEYWSKEFTDPEMAAPFLIHALR